MFQNGTFYPVEAAEIGEITLNISGWTRYL